MANTTATRANKDSNEVYVLRVGVGYENKPVHAELVRFGQSVSIGSAESNWFTASSFGGNDNVDGVIGERYTLFGSQNNAFALRFTEEMSGWVSSGDERVQLKELMSGQSVGGQRAVEKKGVYQVFLSEEMTGMVNVGDYNFLFQFISSPAVVQQQKKPTAGSSSVGGLEEDDAIFFGFLGLFSVIATGLMWWIAIQPRPELLNQEEVEELLAEYLDLDIEEPEEPTTEPSDEEPDEDAPVDPNKAPKEVEKVEEPEQTEKPTEKPTEAEKQSVEKKATASANMTDDQRAAAEDAVSKSFLFQAIGTVGEGSGVVTSAFGGDGAANVDLDKVLDGVTDGQMAVSDAQMKVKGQIDKSGKASTKVGVVSAEGKGGKSVAGPGPKTVGPKSVTKIKKIDTMMGECSDGINKTVRKYLSQVKTCHDISLKSNPSVAGRVEVEVEIADGKVTMTTVTKNTTGDSKVSSCIEKKIRRWRFPSSCSDVAVLPFALSPKN